MTRRLALPSLVLLALVALACPDRPHHPPPVGPDAVLVSFESHPTGAMVGIDGYGYGPTPLSIRVEPGRHRVSVQLPGYLPHRGDLTVRAGRPTSYDADLIASH